MKVKKALKNPLRSFFIASYAIFFILFMVIGLSIILEAPESVINLLQIISAWSSTFTFVLLFKRIYSGSLWDYVKEKFASKINFSVLSTLMIVQVIIVVKTIFILSVLNETPSIALSFTSFGVLIIAFLDNLIRGPLGEELGWRGFALLELQKKYSPLKSGIIIGIIWGFWHTPLWFASGYTGVDLIQYIILFLVGIISFSVVVTLFYNLNKNLLIPIISHQLFNFSLVLIAGDLLDILVYVMLFYLVLAIILVVINPKKILYKKLSSK